METKQGDLSFLRGIYRALFKKGRTYAAFEKDRVFELVQRLAKRKEILDPMAGYGTLMKYCSELNVSAFSIEYNPPAYLWEVLIHPGNTDKFVRLGQRVLESHRNWPTTEVKAIASNDWFPDESKRLIFELFSLCRQIIIDMNLIGSDVDEIAIAFLLPFVGRFSTCVPGNVVTHIKRGGITVYKGWHAEFSSYIEAVLEKLKSDHLSCQRFDHEVVYGDCRTIKLPKERFTAMITSPPFPNSRDYSAMFAPENACLSDLANNKLIVGYDFIQPLIGSVYVSSIKAKNKNGKYKISSISANNFLSGIENFKGAKSAQYDNMVYYLPYFKSYFAELEQAFANISEGLSQDFEGYIIVVNNTARNLVVPVSNAVVENWRNLGFEAEIDNELTREMSHLGSINPRAKGFKARHMEYTIKVWRK